MTITVGLAMTLLFLTLAFIVGAYCLGRFFGRSQGRQEGLDLGYRAGWIERHEDSTPEELEAWRKRRQSKA